jgi:dynamin 1-like protein
MESVLNKCLIPTDDMINKLIEIELGFINTNHPDFIGGTNALISLMQDQNETP